MSVLRMEVAARLKVYVNKDSEEAIELPVASTSFNYAVSEIPTCSVQLALGKNISRPGQQEADLAFISNIQEQTKAQLEIRVLGDWSPNTKWNSEWQVVFEGRIISESNGITRGRANLSLTMVHWLADLQTGTALPTYAHPASPHNPLNPIVSFGAQPNNQATAGLIGTFADANALVQNPDFTEDLWANGIKSLLANILTKEDLTFAGGLSDDCFNIVDSPIEPSQDLKDALKRIEGEVFSVEGSNSDELSSPYSKYAKPLAFTELATDNGIQSYISETITSDPTNTFQTSNLWELLIRRLLPRFGLAIIPRVNSAIVTSYLPALRPTYEHALKADDIFQVDDIKKIRRIARAAFIYVPHKGNWGVNPNVQGGQVARGATGCYYPDDNTTGTSIMYAKPPAWLTLAATRGGGGGQNFVATDNGRPRIRGGAGNPAATPNEDLSTEAEATDIATAGLLDKYAALRYYIERLRGRTLTVHGRLRFDIAPGSTVKVQVRLDDVKGLGGELVDLVGYVERLTTVIDAGSKKAMTSLKLGSVRTAAQNESDKFTIEEEPLFSSGDPFTGCSLLDAYTYES